MAFEGGEQGGETSGADALLGGAGGAGGGGAPAGDAGGDGGAEGAGADGGAGGGAEPDWFAQLSADLSEGETASNRDWAKSVGVKDLDGLAKIARDNQRALRESGRVKVPGEGAKPEEVAAFRTAIGVPEKVDGYEVKGPEGVPLNEPLIAALRESALKHGAPKGAFEGLVNDFIQVQLDEAATETKRQDDLAANWLKEQGGRREEQVAHVNAAMRALELNGADGKALRNALGADRALGLLAKLGAGIAEDTLMTGGKGRFGVSAAEAKTEIDAIAADPDRRAKALKPGTPENARYERLNSIWAQAQAAKDQAA